MNPGNRHTTPTHHRTWWTAGSSRCVLGCLLCAVLTVLGACSADDTGKQQHDGDTRLRLAAVTRSAATDADMANIRLFMTRDHTDNTYYEGLFEHVADNRWNSLVTVTAAKYHIYGFMPDGRLQATIEPVAAGFESGALLTLNGTQAVTPDDYCVITSVKKPTEPDYATGSFAYDNLNDVDDADQNSICLRLEHLYAGLVLKVALGSSGWRDYSTLRSIRLRRLALETKPLSKVSVLLTEGVGIGSIGYVEADGEAQPFTVFDSAEEGLKELNTAADTLSRTARVAPTLAGNLTLTADYDVYDKKGKLLREVRNLRNRLALPAIERGHELVLKLSIEPTYLYQLSDDDLDNPTVKIVN